MSEYADKLWTEASNMRLKAENAKLRELVRKMYSVMDMVDYVHEFDDPMHFMFVDDMRELGIEVDA